MTPLQLYTEDCTVLLERALLGKTIAVFGEDGNGLHGRSDTPKFFVVESLRVELQPDNSSPSMFRGEVQIYLSGYSSDECGHICTDKNFDISIGELLAAASIDKSIFSWSDLSLQGRKSVNLTIDVPKLLGWV